MSPVASGLQEDSESESMVKTNELAIVILPWTRVGERKKFLRNNNNLTLFGTIKWIKIFIRNQLYQILLIFRSNLDKSDLKRKQTFYQWLTTKVTFQVRDEESFAIKWIFAWIMGHLLRLSLCFFLGFSFWVYWFPISWSWVGMNQVNKKSNRSVNWSDWWKR